ncbi:MAG: hypothetical protein MHM6MM_004217 [Cercozoa sp. M6MM]
MPLELALNIYVIVRWWKRLELIAMSDTANYLQEHTKVLELLCANSKLPDADVRIREFIEQHKSVTVPAAMPTDVEAHLLSHAPPPAAPELEPTHLPEESA